MSNEKTYEGETCEGCEYFCDMGPGEDWACYAERGTVRACSEIVDGLDGNICGDFHPTLRCRAVRAAERQADALEKLAGCIRKDPLGAAMLYLQVVR